MLVFGLITTLLDYELNLSNDLARNLKDVEAHADSTGERLTRRSVRQLERNEPLALSEDLAAWAHQPWLKSVALVDEKGMIIDDAEKQWAASPAQKTALAPAMQLAMTADHAFGPQKNRRVEGAMLYGAYPFPIDSRGTGWALVAFDRTDAIKHAREDALEQFRLTAAANAFLCLGLWAALHFGFTARLARLSQAVRDFGDGRAETVEVMAGGDELQELSAAFATMAERLGDREVERAQLEREILETTERERRRIGQDLHDSLGQQLTAASLAANGLISALENNAPQLAPQAERLSRLIRESIAEVRVLSHGLAPVALEDEGLMHALHKLAEITLVSTGVRCIFDCPKQVLLPDVALAGHLHRIAQEAVNNALKHASPHELRIGLERTDEYLILEVDDDGEGLPETLAAGGGIGLRVMRHRAQLIGGIFEICSPPAGGTRIACSIPFPNESAAHCSIAARA